MPITFARRAVRDLANIQSYIAKDSPQAASRMAVEIIAACDRLEQFPERGRLAYAAARGRSRRSGRL